MKHSICIIDDDIPTAQHSDLIDDTKIINSKNLRHLSEVGNDWVDQNLKTLVKKVINDEEHWVVSAFKTPSFYFNYQKENVLISDVIVFDWDYDGNSENSEDHLFELLSNNYAIVYIFTNANSRDEVTRVIESERFNDFRDRLDCIEKDDDNSAAELLKAANRKHRENFSFRFGKELQFNAVKSINDILVQISKLSIEEFVALFGTKKGNNFHISTVDLIDIVAEKFKHQLMGQRFTKDFESVNNFTPKYDEATVKKLWAYRLYHFPKDKVVRKGDILSKKGKNDDTLYLVLSSDCHLDKFWNKNFGFVSMIPLHRLKPSSDNIKQRFIANNSGKLKGFNLSSLTNSSIEGIVVLPGIKNRDGNIYDYLLNVKEVTTIRINLPDIDDIEHKKTNLQLLYTYWKQYRYVDRARISEPFLTPLVQYIFDNISGYGVPDFPDYLQNQIKKSFDAART